MAGLVDALRPRFDHPQPALLDIRQLVVHEHPADDALVDRSLLGLQEVRQRLDHVEPQQEHVQDLGDGKTSGVFGRAVRWHCCMGSYARMMEVMVRCRNALAKGIGARFPARPPLPSSRGASVWDLPRDRRSDG